MAVGKIAEGGGDGSLLKRSCCRMTFSTRNKNPMAGADSGGALDESGLSLR